MNTPSSQFRLKLIETLETCMSDAYIPWPVLQVDDRHAASGVHAAVMAGFTLAGDHQVASVLGEETHVGSMVDLMGCQDLSRVVQELQGSPRILALADQRDQIPVDRDRVRAFRLERAERLRVLRIRDVDPVKPGGDVDHHERLLLGHVCGILRSALVESTALVDTEEFEEITATGAESHDLKCVEDHRS